MSILESSLEDIDEIHQLIEKCFRGDVSRTGWTTEADFFDDGLRIQRAQLETLMSAPDAIMLKYVDNNNGKIIGCVYTCIKLPHLDKLYVGMLSVDPNLQSKGIGKQLMKVTEDIAKRRKCIAVRLRVISVRNELQQWYESQGYQLTGDVDSWANEPGAKVPFVFNIMEKIV